MKKDIKYYTNGQFTGTSQYYKYQYLYLTDGVIFVAENFKAFWLLDIINSYLSKLKDDFYFVKLIVDLEKKTAEFEIWEGDVRVIQQHIDYTDMPANVMLYLGVADEQRHFIVCLPSED